MTVSTVNAPFLKLQNFKMKTTLLLICLLASSTTFSQCFKTNRIASETDEPNVTFGFIGEYSLKYAHPSGFSGVSVYAGMWAGSDPNWPGIGLFIGYVESKWKDGQKLNSQGSVIEQYPATREAAFRLSIRQKLFKETVQVVPFFSVGTNNFQDIGILAGVKIQQGTYVNIFTSRMLHYGIGVTASIF